MRVSGLELGGLVGSLVAGRLSDYLINRDSKGGSVGKRVQVGRGQGGWGAVWLPCLRCRGGVLSEITHTQYDDGWLHTPGLTGTLAVIIVNVLEPVTRTPD